MTKKDYEALAAVFRAYIEQVSAVRPQAERHSHALIAATYLAREMSNVLAQDNPRFCTITFLTKAGVK